MKTPSKIILLLFILWTAVLGLRSIQYIFRTFKEFRNPPIKVYENINICEIKKSFSSLEEERLYNYFQIGGKCKKQ